MGRQLILLGCGALGHAVLDSLCRFPVLQEAFTVIAVDKRTPEFVEAGSTVATFEEVVIARDNIQHLFDKVLRVSAGDVVLDLLVNVSPVPLLEACVERDAHYLNAATDTWSGDVFDLLSREHGKLIELQAEYNSRPGGAPTCFLEQGMNPGMVNIFALKALAEAAEASGIAWPHAEQFKGPDGVIDKKGMLSARAEAARHLGLTSIHSTDVDYHLSANYKHSNKVLASTWSSTSFWEECALPAQWHTGTVGAEAAAAASSSNGTTLKPLFDITSGINASTPGRQAFATWTRSYSGPEGYFNGMVVPHGESPSLGRSLTVWSADKTPAWSPEVAFIYRPNNLMLASCFLHGCDGSVQLADIQPYILHTEHDQLEGQESVGVLLRFEANSACKYRWIWAGNTLGYTDPALRHPVHNATILQVAGGVLAAVEYMLASPREGICWPEEAADTELIVSQSLPLLGCVDVMHGCESLTGMPKLLTSPGAGVQLHLQAELQHAVAAVRGTESAAGLKAAAPASRGPADITASSRDQCTAVKA